ncbi:AAA family ATPase [Mycoplasmatota bacterium WC30]
MKILELNLTSFGKFVNKKIQFKDGLNVVTGMNEAGKSTIHKFIEGMFFGFIKTNVKKRIYNDYYEAYQPRTRSDYLGSMILEFNGKKYRIERDFNKSKPDLKIFDQTTGNDISGSISENKVTRLPDLAGFLGLNYTMFENTISISQMKNETEDNLATVVVEKLTNINTTRDETISIRKINDAIDKDINEIGTKKMKTKPLFLTMEKLKDLKQELIVSKDNYKKTMSLQHEVSRLNDSKSSVSDSLKKLENQKSVYKNEQLKEKYYKAEKLLKDKEDLLVKTADLSKYQPLNQDDYDLALSIKPKLESAKENREELSSKNRIIRDKIDKLKSELLGYSYLSAHPLKYIDVNNMYYEYTRIDSDISKYKEEKIRLSNSKVEVDDRNLDDLKSDYINFKEINEINYDIKTSDIISKITTKENEILYLENRKPKASILLLYILLCLVIVGFFLIIKYNKTTKKTEEELAAKRIELNILTEEEKSINQSKEEQNRITNNLLNKYKLKSKVEFDVFYQENSQTAKASLDNSSRLKEIGKLLETNSDLLNETKGKLENILLSVINTKTINEESLSLIKNTIETYEGLTENLKNLEASLSENKIHLDEEMENYKSYKLQLDNIFSKNKVDSIENFKIGLENKRLFIISNQELNSLEARIKDQLGNLSFDELKSVIDFDSDIEFDEEIYNELNSREATLRGNLSQFTGEEAKIQEEIRQIEFNNRDLGLIKNDIDVNEARLNKYEEKLNDLMTVKKILDELSEDISYEFAPTLNKVISEIVSEVTNSKYDDVKLDRSMDVKMIEKASQKLVSIYGFSKGTIDQVYFAMRIGINKILSENINPFLLDDAFVNYDSKRLENVIQIIANESKSSGRQVVLLTCQDRETTIMKKLNLKANIVEISE